MNLHAVDSEAVVNPAWLSPQAYIDFLNRSFGGQWDRTAYDWYLTRPFDGRAPDLLVLAQEDRILSGLGMAYRQIQIGDGPPIDVAVLLAAATLPEERRCGHYARVLQRACEHARLRGCAALLAFATQDSSSGRGWLQSESLAIPSFYLVADRPRSLPGATRHGRAPHDSSLACLPRMADQLQELMPQTREAASRRCARFYYPHTEDWVAQFISRPGGTHLTRPTARAVALIETVHATQRLQWYAARQAPFEASVRALVQSSRRHARGFFMYTANVAEARAARRAGCRIRDGYLLLRPTGHAPKAWAALAGTDSWSVQSGDRL